MKKRILVVDDEPAIASMVSEILQRTQRYETTTVNDPVEAQRIAGTTKYDLVISDVRMPKMTGDLMYRCMDTDPETGCKTVRRPKMLLMSGAFAEDELARRQREIGAAMHLQKPFRAAALIEAVDGLLAE
jgi:CheY-like chemotaxis protein